MSWLDLLRMPVAVVRLDDRLGIEWGSFLKTLIEWVMYAGIVSIMVSIISYVV